MHFLIDVLIFKYNLRFEIYTSVHILLNAVERECKKNQLVKHFSMYLIASTAFYVCVQNLQFSHWWILYRFVVILYVCVGELVERCFFFHKEFPIPPQQYHQQQIFLFRRFIIDFTICTKWKNWLHYINAIGVFVWSFVILSIRLPIK